MKTIKIGRHDSNDIVVNESNSLVSKFHAVITKNDDGTFLYEDRSTNGTKINGKIIHNQTVTIVPGDEILLAGQYHLLWNLIENSNGGYHGGVIYDPEKDMIWDNRYRLVERLGKGATAQVWEALDTKAGNIKVALKIFSAFGNIGTRGIQFFEKEFTTVHGLIQTNLLVPSSYDTYGNIPYLVSKFCEKGSADGLKGKLSEEQIIKFMKDTAQGLDYLHKHDIVHQDIKPENILIDDDDNYVLTDFGISNQSEKKDQNGTPAYMGPERWGKNPISTSKSDIWSLGATVFEMITGDVPFGDGQAGAIQASGEKIPDFPESFTNKKIKDLVVRCLDIEPENRPSAEEIVIALEDDNPIKLWIIAAAVALLLGIVSLVAVNHFRLKTKYFKDYAEYFGVPKGIHELSSNEKDHLSEFYKFEIKRGKVQTISFVNNKEIIIRHNDSETMNNRFSHAKYYYTDNGKLDIVEIFNEQGKMLYKIDYDENMKTATYRQCDELGTEMFLPANTTSLDFVQQNTWGDEFSNIQRITLEFTSDGLLTKKMYLAPGNKPAHDVNNIYGISYQYDEKGRQKEVCFLNKNGEVTANKIGLAIKQFSYDENDNLIEYRYLNPERQAARDDNGAIVLKVGFDEYGNRSFEQYFTLDGQPSVRTDMNAHKLEYVLDPKTGLILERKTYGIDLNPICTSNGWVKATCEYDENGFIKEINYFDENDNPVVYSSTDNTETNFHKQIIINSPTGLVKEFYSYDTYNQPALSPNGVFKNKIEYDSVGNEIKRQYFDANGNFVNFDGKACQYELSYDDKYNLVKITYKDSVGNLAENGSGYAYNEVERDNYGRLIKSSYYDVDGKLVDFDDYAYRTYKYDDFGNIIEVSWFDTEGNPSEGIYATKKLTYDQNTNFCTKIAWINENDKIGMEDCYKYDNIGNKTQEYRLNEDKKIIGVVTNYEYDSQNRETKRYATDLNGNRINFDGESYCEVRFEKYDVFNNVLIHSYWDKDSNPAVYKPGVHKYEQELDYRGKAIHEISYGIDGNPADIEDVEGKCVYDVRGNMTELSVYDGYGKPRLGSNGFFKEVMTYDSKNKELTCAFFDTNESPMVSKVLGYHKRQYTYNDKGNVLTEEYYDENNQPTIPNQKGFHKKQISYDDKGNITKTEWFGTPDKEITLRYAKIVNQYDSNSNKILTEYHSTKQCEEIDKYKYDDKNNLIEECQYDGSNNLYWKILYNEYGKAKERYQYDGKSKYVYKYVIHYDKDNNTPTREDVYDPSGSRIAYRNYMNGWGDYQMIQQANSNSWISLFRNTKWPYKWNNAYSLTKYNISGNTVTVWVKAVNVSKYDTDKESGVRNDVRNIKSSLTSMGDGKPSNCTLKLRVIDKANRDWFNL